MSKVIIEKGTIDDLEEIVSLNYQIFKGMYENDPYSLAQYRNKLKDKNPIIFISKVAGKIISNSISFEKDDSLYIWILGVAKESREKGIGNLLLGASENFAKDAGFNSLTVKVYGMSQEMQELLKWRNYQVKSIEKNDSNSKYDILHFELEI